MKQIVLSEKEKPTVVSSLVPSDQNYTFLVPHVVPAYTCTCSCTAAIVEVDSFMLHGCFTKFAKQIVVLHVLPVLMLCLL